MLKADNIVSARQYYLAIFVTVFLLSLLLARFFQLQILDHDKYSKKKLIQTEFGKSLHLLQGV